MSEFSSAGKNMGERDRLRGRTIWKIITYVGLQQPRIVVLENVRGLLTHHRKTLDKIVRQLQEVKTMKQISSATMSIGSCWTH